MRRKMLSRFHWKLACNQSSKVICTEQYTSTGCQVTVVIGDNGDNRAGGVGGLSTLEGNWLVLSL